MSLNMYGKKPITEASKDLGTIHVIHHPTKGYRQKGGGYSKEINKKTKTFKSHDTAAKSDNSALHYQHHDDPKTGKQHTSYHPSTNRGTRVHTVNTATGKVTKGDYLHHHQATAAQKLAKKNNSEKFPTRAGKTHADDIPKSKKFDHVTQKGHYVEDKVNDSLLDAVKSVMETPKKAMIRDRKLKNLKMPNPKLKKMPLDYNKGMSVNDDVNEEYLDEVRIPPYKEVMKVIGPTKNANEGMAAIRRKFGVSEKQAEEILRKTIFKEDAFTQKAVDGGKMKPPSKARLDAIQKQHDAKKKADDDAISKLRGDKMSETKEAPPGTYFTKSGQLKKGDPASDGPGGEKLASDPLDKQRKTIVNLKNHPSNKN